MYPILMAFLLLLSSNLYSQDNNSSSSKIKTALGELKKLIDSQKPFNKNPLNAYTFENFCSRSYLYYYRALGNSLLAKNTNQAQKLMYLNKSLSDLKLAKLSPSIDSQRIEQLTNATLKDLIELLVREKKYRLVIDYTEQLSQSDRQTPKYIIYYAYALFNTSQHDNLKRLASQYFDILNDEKAILGFLPGRPKWTSHLAQISSLREEAKHAKIVANTPKYTKNAILDNPRITLEYLNKFNYFSDADAIFKLASPLYFSLLKKINPTAQEGEFVSLFERLMSSFAPAFLDELVMAHWKQADLKTAQKLSEAFLKQYEGHALYPKVLYNLGRIQEDAQNYSGAFNTFKRFIALSDSSSYLEFARFRAPWVLYLDKKHAQSSAYFEEYVKNYPEGRYASTCEYFLAKISRSQESANNFIKKYPLNLYSYILADELKLTNQQLISTLSLEDSIKKFENNFNIFKADIKTIAQLSLVRELLDFGLKEDAIKVLKSISFVENNEVLALYLAAQLHELKDTHGEVSNLVKAFSSSSSIRQYIPWKSLFPPFRFEVIDKALAYQNSKLSKFLVLSIIRQESMFESQARSSANALGLMQLTQATANQSANSLGLKDFSLLKEEDNLKLGIKTMSDLLKKFDNRLDYALCAYNAGETPTRLWIKLRGNRAPIEFIESIPYQETRQYVKNILRNYAIYKMIYNQPLTNLVSYSEI